ncbi:hypothetical protein FRZ67_04590 [Panacibacter ginsenosidivorans]|uniref:Uncharacterized protein n=1 Tax=Panacibacter ginsenosidivorans TaxID=1813871 RepID=A0A5B8V5F0_9BACT|nr:hypothetical protein [Panacibacter ginsenosidivorans]QEC66610.1 hypothetical protein FRZ67_04590 [Panacibacter ginsenosidivorans]
MQEDKKLGSLLTTYAMQEPSTGFEEMVMQRIAAAKKIQLPITPLISRLLQRTLITTFIAAAVALIIIAFFIEPNTLILKLDIPVQTSIFEQLFSFFIVFWIVMFVNFFWGKRFTIAIKG